MSKLVNEASIPALLEEMSVKEKVDLLVGKSFFSTQEMPKYGIPSIRYLDGATGVNLMQYMGELVGLKMAVESEETPEAAPAEEKQPSGQETKDDASNNESGAAFMGLVGYATNHKPLPEDMTAEQREMIEGLRALVDSVRPEGEEPGCFPPGMLLGATWEPEIVYQVGEAVAREAIAYGVDVLLGTPNTNIHRDPRNGRVFESFSEDPCLSSRMAAQFPKGVQDQGMVADVKHFAANNQETLRQGINEHISERALREIYLPGFEAAVKEGHVGTVMSAYNSINGKPCAQNEWLLTKVLKGEWGFDGQVVSDWGAVYNQVEALKAGNDMDMPGPRGKKVLYQAVESGEISMERLDDAVARMLKLILKTPKFNGKKYTRIDNELSRRAAYRAAAEGITLLKNDGVLPLGKGTKVALFGRLTDRFMESGSGSAQVDTGKFTSLPTEVARYSHGVSIGEIEEDTKVVIITAGASGQEGSDRPDMDFDPEDKAMLRETIDRAKKAGKEIVLLLNVAGPVELEEYMDDLDALVCMFFPGMEGARAVADILFGEVNPSGKLPLTFPKTYRDCPTSLNFPGEFGEVTYGEGIFVGYRYYDTKDVEPLFPFGFGLSYTDYEITGMKLSADTYANDATDPLKISVTVRNAAHNAGKEVVQVYVRDPKSTLQKPEKELKAFTKVALAPGESKTVTLELMPKDFASYDTALQQWTIEPGTYEILVGDSSRTIMADAKISVTGKNPYGYSLRSSCGFIAANPEAMAACSEVLGEAFDVDAFISQAIYFTGTPFGKYLERIQGMLADTPQGQQEVLDRLSERLEEIAVPE